jgi:hypothetical protein
MTVSYHSKMGDLNLPNRRQFNRFGKTLLRLWYVCLIGPRYTRIPNIPLEERMRTGGGHLSEVLCNGAESRVLLVGGQRRADRRCP